MARTAATPTLPALPAERKYIVVGPGVWGADADFTKALKNAKKEFGSGRGWKYLVFDAHVAVRVDDMGGFVWMPEETGTESGENPYREVMRVGFVTKGGK